MSSKSQTLDNINKCTFNRPSELLTFSAEILRKTKYPEKRQFVRETAEAFILIRGLKLKIADISVSGLKLEKKLLAKKMKPSQQKLFAQLAKTYSAKKLGYRLLVKPKSRKQDLL